MNRIIVDKLLELKEICKNHYVKELYAFGSVCTHEFRDDSDIDFLVSFHSLDYGDYTDNYFSLIEELENLFNRKIDLITNKSLSNPYFIKSLEKTKTELYAA
jgi:predicted nucleotidyltransferase